VIAAKTTVELSSVIALREEPSQLRDGTEQAYADMMARYLGNAIMKAFDDDDVTEVYRNSHPDVVWYDTRSRGRIDSGERLDANRCEMFLNAAAASQNATLSLDTPRVQAELPMAMFRRSRLQGFVPPASSGPAFNIRKPPTVIYSLDDYVSAGSLSRAQRAALREAVIMRWSVLVAGGTNTGKTTLCNALLREVTDCFPQDRVVILEDTVELQCCARDYLALRTGDGLNLSALVRSSLRTSPNRIVVGEVRGAEALDLLDAWATGHPGGCGTVHASSAEGALNRLDRLAQRSGVPPQRSLVAEAVDLVVVTEGGNSGRRVADLARVVGLDPTGQFVLQHLTQEGDWK
jgi:type IV secretion system protein TrbB